MRIKDYSYEYRFTVSLAVRKFQLIYSILIVILGNLSWVLLHTNYSKPFQDHPIDSIEKDQTVENTTATAFHFLCSCICSLFASCDAPVTDA